MRLLFLSPLLLLIAGHTLAEEVQCSDTHAIRSVVPKYPLNESPNPQTGYVVLSFKISDRGYVYSPKVLASHAEPSEEWAKLFEEEAIKAIMQFHFRYRERACVAKHKFEFDPKK